MQIRGMWSAGPGDDEARFLADLRALRDMSAIGYDELAARAHFPSDILKEAENGPLLPGLPILTAYVRACEGDVPDWEERWRRLAAEVAEDPGLPVRPAGASPAAVAGARAGIGVAPPDVYDPERIRAALRGGHQRSDQSARKASGPGWDAASDPSRETANGNHAASPWSREPFDGVVAADSAEGAEQTDRFHWLPDNGSGSWSADTGPTATGRTDTGRTDTGQDDTGRDDNRWADNGWAEAAEAEAGQAAPAAVDVDGTAAEPTAHEWTPPHQDDLLKPPERTDFWTTSRTAAPADLQLPVTAYRIEEQEPPQADWPSSAETTATATSPARPGVSQRPQQPAADATANARSATAAAPLASAGSTGSTGATASAGFTGSTETAAKRMPATEHAPQKDRLFPARLLVIIVIAALIGSALVLLLS
ncbi:MAG TPA: hypothetical protein VHO07_18990 [Streptosporangiaceae bacterium]|nr:hypothetical protein [Streptosporangiaceae bacterium]